MASLSITVIERRMLSLAEAASYCGLSVAHFKAVCPVAPVELRPGKLLYDRQDLDRWIDNAKTGAHEAEHATILRKLG
ncbi:MAG: hypothetical protein ACXIUV_09885 [Alkalilacustris sp.]